LNSPTTQSRLESDASLNPILEIPDSENAVFASIYILLDTDNTPVLVWASFGPARFHNRFSPGPIVDSILRRDFVPLIALFYRLEKEREDLS
jgi:hypothetical protein